MNKLQNKRLTKLGNHLLNRGDHMAGWNYNYFVAVLEVLRKDADPTYNMENLYRVRRKVAAGLSNGMRTSSGRNLIPIPTKRLCGTLGCALGECSLLFPRNFKVAYYEDNASTPHLELFVYNKEDKEWDGISTYHSSLVQDFFGLEDHSHFRPLFLPTSYKVGFEVFRKGGMKPVVRLPNEATMKQVGQNILNYLKIFGS